jgi:hypothetical protein
MKLYDFFVEIKDFEESIKKTLCNMYENKEIHNIADFVSVFKVMFPSNSHYSCFDEIEILKKYKNCTYYLGDRWGESVEDYIKSLKENYKTPKIVKNFKVFQGGVL